MNRKILLKMLICFSLVSVLVLSTPLLGSAGEKKKPIKVGVATTITGPLADDGRHHVRAMEMARDEINAAGGLLLLPL
jgi:ABC-type branched-subunit amino acid transport system substrate-binding protein